MFSFDITHKKGLMRSGIFETPHRKIETPEFAIVATDAQLRSLSRDAIKDLPSPYFIVNTYHTYTKKIIPQIAEKGGVHSFMEIPDRVVASDSGGFQVFSLGFGRDSGIGKILPTASDLKHIHHDDTTNRLEITEEGVEFEFDGQPTVLNPEISMDLQHQIGADIMMAFDECTSPLNSYEYIKTSMERTHRWLDRSIAAHRGFEMKQALFGIVQGGEHQALREESARVVGSKDVPGFGIGGSFGDFKEALGTTVQWVNSLLPPEKPRHLLGIGKVRDIFAGVENGVDLFDCVIPTREARHRMLYTKRGRLYLRKSKHIEEPIDPSCRCPACHDKVTMKQLRDWFLVYDKRGVEYMTLHNIQFYADLTREIREAIEMGMFDSLKDEYYKYY